MMVIKFSECSEKLDFHISSCNLKVSVTAAVDDILNLFFISNF